MPSSLTICTVSFNSASFIQLNYDFIRRLNPGAEFEFLVVDNTPEKKREARIVPESVPYSVYPGVEADVTNETFPKGDHHGRALNKVIREVKTRYALILDPDFFIVRPNWIEDVLTHMKQKSLAFFGAPYSPRYPQKYRYFPTVMCVFIDLEQVNKDALNFRPGIHNPLLARKELRLRRRRSGPEEVLEYWNYFAYRPFYVGRLEDTG